MTFQPPARELIPLVTTTAPIVTRTATAMGTRASLCGPSTSTPSSERTHGKGKTDMRLPATLVILAAASLLGTARATSSDALPTATIFAPGAIAGAADDGAAAFTPDGATVYFMRGTDSFTLMESQRKDGHWSTPRAAPFSGQWRDLDPAMAPDGSFLLFISNRPAVPGGKPIDEVHAGHRRTGEGMNLWRVDRVEDVTPHRSVLPRCRPSRPLAPVSDPVTLSRGTRNQRQAGDLPRARCRRG